MSPLGRGGMGFVFRANDEIVGEDVALKLLLSAGRAEVEAFKAELRLARRVTHKNVGRTFDMGRVDECLFITMELVLGGCLRSVMNQVGAFSPSDAAWIARQIASGLGAAHEVGIVHRDLKPGNVLLAPDGRVVIIDWGIASTRQPDVAGTTSGTLDYMAPEQLRGESPCPSHDVYALGVVLFELVAHARLFSGPDATARAKQKLSEAPDLSPLGASLEYARLVAACLDRDGDRRPSALEIERRLTAMVVPETAPTLSLGLAPEEAATVAATALAPPLAATIGVQPFAVEGIDQGFDLGRAFAGELTDTLSMIRGLGVPSLDTDPRHSPSARYRLSGTLRRGEGGALDVKARLVEQPLGTQVWVGRFSTTTTATLQAAREIAARIAEALRMELELLEGAASLPGGAALAYLEAQNILRSALGDSSDALAAFERCLAEAPGFAPAIAGRALASAQIHALGDGNASAGDWAGAMASALASAPTLVDTHIAQATLSFGEARFGDGLVAITRALQISPMHAKAHEQLGRLECEAGEAERGTKRILAALKIEPRLRQAVSLAARAHALRGRMEAFDLTLASVSDLGPRTFEEWLLEARVSVWFQDRQRAADLLARLPAPLGNRAEPLRFAVMSAKLVLGEEALWEMRAMAQSSLEKIVSQRLRCTLWQLQAESEGAYGDPMRALDALEAALGSGLIDLEWLALCHALEVVRDQPRYQEVLSVARTRARALWIDYEVPPIPLAS